VSIYRLGAAVILYRLTGDVAYKQAFEASYLVADFNLFKYTWTSGYDLDLLDIYLDYTTLPDADATVKSGFLEPFENALASDDNLGSVTANPDPYLGHHRDMTWGSNNVKAKTGLVQYSYVTYGLDATKHADATRAASRYAHYIHGVNPLGLVYLSAMERFGAHASVSTLYHTWFAHGSEWDTNPAPGFLVGGPNSSYDWEVSCCVNNSCDATSKALCDDRPSPDQTPDAGSDPPTTSHKPALKAYWQFNESWPLNSWSVTENSDGYQLAYVRLLSKFVN
jgi:hypothetical protein